MAGDGHKGQHGTGGERSLPKREAAHHRNQAELNDAVLWMTLNLAFFFLLRAGEYCAAGDARHERVLRGVDVSQRADGLPAPVGQATETAIQFRKQKADQMAFGMTRTHYSSNQDLCVVQAVERVRALAPRRFEGGAESHLPLCRWADGTAVKREEVQQVLQRAARAVGLPEGRFKSHSLRIGGATAMYHSRPDTELVKRFGRWTSSAFQAYLWAANEGALGLAAEMAACEVCMCPPTLPTLETSSLTHRSACDRASANLVLARFPRVWTGGGPASRGRLGGQHGSRPSKGEG